MRAVCLPQAESPQGLDLARIGANARQATEDSAAVGYIGEPTRAATRFSAPILEEAGIAQLPTTSGVAAMKQLIRVIERSGAAGNMRQSVNDDLR